MISSVLGSINQHQGSWPSTHSICPERKRALPSLWPRMKNTLCVYTAKTTEPSGNSPPVGSAIYAHLKANPSENRSLTEDQRDFSRVDVHNS